MAKKKAPKFDQKKPSACCHMGDSKFISQGGNLFSYSEAGGTYVHGEGRPLVPTPKFVMSKKDWDKAETQRKYEKAQLTAMAASHQLSILKKKLEAEGVLDDTS
jgi:hypothetical protein